MRKILSLVLVLSLVLGSASMAFAAPSSVSADVEDKNVKAAVERLIAFGIVNGMDDGKYHPENEVTREQFAKILVTALGMESAAGAVSSTSFTDVASDRWSAGYVEVAAGQGLIKGYPDGTFQPTKGVSYAEAVTMLVRALGYKDEFLSGSWPANYIAKASEEGITKKVGFSSSTKVADRGSVAVMVNNALDAEVIKVSEYDGSVTKYEETDRTLLEDKLEIFELENVRILENAKLNSSLDKNEISVIMTDDTDFKGEKDAYEEDEDYDFEVVDGFDSDYYLGLETTAFLNDDDEVVYAEITDTGNTVYRNDRLDYAYDEKPVGEITLYNAEVDLEVDPETVSIYVDGEKIKENEVDNYIGGDIAGIIFGTWIADDDELVYANLVTWEKANYLVQEVEADKDTIVYLDTKSADDDKDIDLADDYDKYDIYLVDGEELVNIELSDLEEGDVFNIAEVEEDDDDVAAIYVWRNSVVGDMGKITGANNSQRMGIYVGDDKHSAESYFTYTDDSGDDFTAAKGINDGAMDTKKDLEDFYKEEVKIYKNWKNRIVYLSGDVNTTSDELYGVVLKYGSGIEEKVKLYTKDDDNVTYEFEESEDFEYLEEHAPVGSIIKYELNKDGEIAEYGKYNNVIFKTSDTATIKDGDDFGSKSVEIDGKTYYVDKDETIFFDYTEHDEDEVEVFDWSDIKGKDVEEDVTVIFAKDGSALEFLAIWDNLDDIRDDVMVGYVVDTFDEDGDYYAEVAVYGEDEIQKYELTSKIAKEIEDDELLLDGRVWLFETTSGGKYDVIDPADEKGWEIVAGMVEDIDGDKLTIEDEEYVVEDDALIYQGSSEESFSKIDEKDFVVLALEKGEAKAIELVYAKDSGDDFGEGKITSIDPFEVKGFDQEFTDDIADALLGNGYIRDDNDLDDYHVGDEIKFLYETDRDEIQIIWAETTGDNVDSEVEDVEEAISDLPDADDITLSDKDAVEEAREAYDDLSSSQQDKVDSDLVEKLEDCEAKLEELGGGDDEDEDAITNATAKNAVILTAITGDVKSNVDKVEIEFNDKTKVALIKDGKFEYAAPVLSEGTEVTIKAYVGEDVVDTDTVEAK